MIEFTISYPPSVNHYKKMGGLAKSASGHLYRKMVTAPETRKYYWEVWKQIKAQGIEGIGKARLTMEIDIYAPDNRKRDIDNITKCALDAMQKAGLFENDYQIDRLLLTRLGVKAPEGELVVRISVVDGSI